jgi:transitional endoplasmic reticulum ATPase
VSIDSIADQTEGFNGAEIQAICTRAAWIAIREALADHDGSDDIDRVEIQITPEHVQLALEEVRHQSQH